MAKKLIKLTEDDLHKIVKESVKNVIKEENGKSEEDVFVIATKLLNEVGGDYMYKYLCNSIVRTYGQDVLYRLLFDAIKFNCNIKWEYLTR